MKRVRKVNERVRDLIEGAMRHPDGTPMTKAELSNLAGKGSRYVEAMVRGEILRPTPEQLRLITRHLPITERQLLEAYGFDVGLSKQERLPKELVDAWADLTPRDQQLVLDLAHRLGGGRTGDSGPLR